MIDWLRQSFRRLRSVFRREQLDHDSFCLAWRSLPATYLRAVH
jgi:hypothetical protein